MLRSLMKLTILIPALFCNLAVAQSLSVPVTPGLAAVLPPKNNCSGQSGLACVMPNLFGPYGLVLPNSNFPARFNSSFQSTFSALNDAIATQITLLPIASPASGFMYEYDSATGVYKRLPETFGPVLTERAETIGRRRLHVGVTFQRFRFDTIDGKPLHNWPAIFTHEVGTGPGGAAEPYETQFISSNNSLDLKVNQFTLFGTYGLTDRIDISVAIPFLQIGMNAASYATINRTVDTEPAIVNGVLQPCCSNGPPYANYFDPANPATSLTNTFSNNQYAPDVHTNPAKTNNLYWNPSRNSAAGLGDVTLRFKGRIYRGERVNVSLLTDLRLPTGDEMNLLGSGAIGWKPFVAVSLRSGPITPHVNVGYQWNGQSILAGNIITGTKANLPGYAFLSAGTDLGITRRFTLAADYIGQELINAPRVGVATYTSQAPLVGTGQIGTFATAAPLANQTYNQSNLALGMKTNIFDGFLVSANMLVALNDGGLREKVIPLIGVSYTF
ncbi:MAG: hypothetical protein JOY62_06400 [Acidobacteriaceae bacterium]|nr:hypothetical protein [Acidobacteriaceae bacterium]MBV9779588.1 hypothetical protein [Acidobacteriaceae bacterium]